MARTADPGRRSELTERILEHLLDHPLATVTFRSLASALGVSTYMLVYHFGTRANLIAEVIGAVSARQDLILKTLRGQDATIEDYFEAYRITWAWLGSSAGRRRSVVDFEAALLTVRDAGPSPAVAVYQRWIDICVAPLVRFGVAADEASVAVRSMLATVLGLKYLHVITGDAAAATEAFEHALAAHRRVVLALLAESSAPPVTESTGG